MPNKSYDFTDDLLNPRSDFLRFRRPYVTEIVVFVETSTARNFDL